MTSQTSYQLCQNKEQLPRNDTEVRQRLSNQLRAVPVPRDLSGLRARTEKLL